LKFVFIAAEKASYPVDMLCRVLEVSRSSFFAWRKSGIVPRKGVSAHREIEKVFAEGRGAYGKRRVQAGLARRGVRLGLKTVSREMQQLNLVAKTRRKIKRTTDSNHKLPIAPNRLEDGFNARHADQYWTTDITYIRTSEGWLYLCIFLDLFSRRVVGWKTSERIDRHLVIGALKNAVLSRSPAPGVVVHSDRGSQYCSRDFRLACGAAGINQSMGLKGSAYDNACAETFFATLKKEMVFQMTFATRTEAEKEIFEYIEVFYNRQRLHSALGYRAPVEYERVAA
jgi:putative transposase